MKSLLLVFHIVPSNPPTTYTTTTKQNKKCHSSNSQRVEHFFLEHNVAHIVNKTVLKNIKKKKRGLYCTRPIPFPLWRRKKQTKQTTAYRK